MKHSFIFLLCCSLFATAITQAQWSDTHNRFSDSLAMPVAQAANDQKNPLVIKSEPDDSYFVIWEDYRNGSSNADIYAQKYDRGGNRLWAENGVPVATGESEQRYSNIYIAGGSNDLTYSYREVSHAADDGAGGFYIAYNDQSTGNAYNGIYMQHIQSNGARVFGEGGYALAATTSQQECKNPQLIGDGQGGCFIGYAATDKQHTAAQTSLVVNGYKDEGGTLKAYENEGSYLSNGVSNYSLASFKIFPDGQGGCGAFTMNEYNGQDSVGLLQLCRVKKDCKAVQIKMHIESISGIAWDDSWIKDWFNEQYHPSALSLPEKHRVYDTLYTDDPYGWVRNSVGGSDAADYYVDAYLDSLQAHGRDYPGYLIAMKYYWLYDTTTTQYTKGGLITMGYPSLHSSTASAIEQINAAALRANGGNIIVFALTWNERDIVNSNLTDWTTRYAPVASAIYDTIPWQFSSTPPVDPNPSDPLNVITGVQPPPDLNAVTGEGIPVTLINAHPADRYAYSLCASGSRVMLATEALVTSTTAAPLYYQELELERKDDKTFALNLNTSNPDGIVLGLGSNAKSYGHSIPSLSGDGNGNAMYSLTQYHSPLQASPVGEAGKLLWGAMGVPLGSLKWNGRYHYPDNPYIYTDRNGQAVIAWQDDRDVNDGVGAYHIYMRHLDSLLNTTYQPPLLKALLTISPNSSSYQPGGGEHATQSAPATLSGSSNAWTVFGEEVYDGGSDYTPVAMIRDDYNLGTVTVQTNESYGRPLRILPDGHPYLDRNYTITVTNHPENATIYVRLIFTKAEFDSLKAHDASIKDPGDLAVIKQPNTSGSLIATYTPVAGEQGIRQTGWGAIENNDEITGYYIEIAIKDFSNFFIAGSLAVLPVKLQYFTVKAVNNTALLQWQTATETNNSRFDIERSADGKNFTKIGSVQGHGTTSIPQDYHFTDAAPLTGSNYYHLAQVDMDGHTDYSGIRLLVSGGQSGGFKIFPNPSKGTVHIQLPAAATGQQVLQLYNAAGQQVLQQVVPAGSTQSDMDISALANGIYILKYGDASIKVIKQ